MIVASIVVLFLISFISIMRRIRIEFSIQLCRSFILTEVKVLFVKRRIRIELDRNRGLVVTGLNSNGTIKKRKKKKKKSKNNRFVKQIFKNINDIFSIEKIRLRGKAGILSDAFLSVIFCGFVNIFINTLSKIYRFDTEISFLPDFERNDIRGNLEGIFYLYPAQIINIVINTLRE